MNPIPNIKRFVLRALARTQGLPLPDASLNTAIGEAIVPRPLQSDINQAKRDLEADGFIHGQRDELDETAITWTLTDRGSHKAAQLG